jgi:hypothetical protein
VERLKPTPEIKLHFVKHADTDIGVIVIKPVRGDVVISEAGAFVRHGEQDIAMSADEMQQRLTKEVTNQHLLDMIATLNDSLAKVHEDVRYPLTIRGRATTFLLGFAAGFLAKICAEVFIGYFAPKPHL